MKNSFRIILSLLIMLVLGGCSADHEALLSIGIWNFQDMSTDSRESEIISITSLAEALLTNATLEFQEGGTYIINSPYLQEPITGEWQLIGDDRLIFEPYGGSSSTSIIKTLSRERLSYSESFSDGQANTYTVTTIWKRN